MRRIYLKIYLNSIPYIDEVKMAKIRDIYWFIGLLKMMKDGWFNTIEGFIEDLLKGDRLFVRECSVEVDLIEQRIKILTFQNPTLGRVNQLKTWRFVAGLLFGNMVWIKLLLWILNLLSWTKTQIQLLIDKLQIHKS